jgi:hypothetical protein
VGTISIERTTSFSEFLAAHASGMNYAESPSHVFPGDILVQMFFSIDCLLPRLAEGSLHFSFLSPLPYRQHSEPSGLVIHGFLTMRRQNGVGLLVHGIVGLRGAAGLSLRADSQGRMDRRTVWPERVKEGLGLFFDEKHAAPAWRSLLIVPCWGLLPVGGRARS